MIEMRVREVRRVDDQKRAVAVLERAGDGDSADLELELGAADGHALAHELRSHGTMRAHAYGLMAKVLSSLHGRISAVEIIANKQNEPAGRLRVVGPEGELRIAVCIGQALGLAVSQKIPLLVAESLLSAPAVDEPVAEPSAEVPDVFLRAFVE